MNQDNLNKLITEAMAIEQSDASEAGTIGYMARMLVQATMPHSNPFTNTFERTNGNFSLAILAHPQIGLPYGCYPRLLLAWLTTEAVTTKEHTLVLGDNLSRFMSKLGLSATGGRWGTIWRLREQMRRLFSSSISCVFNSDKSVNGINFNIAKEYQLWWDPKQPNQSDLWQSTVTLSHDFFEEIVSRPVPLDMRALQALKNSSMALDLYCWLTYRLSYLRKSTEIPWQLLQQQFGSNYADSKQGRHKFKQKLLYHLKKVSLVYDEVKKIQVSENGLVLKQGKPHVKKIILQT